MTNCYKCDNEATNTIELNPPTGWRTTLACDDHSGGRYVYEVYGGVDTDECAYERCYNEVHASRDYCSSHKYDHQR